jgi:hypothetical protein
MKIGINKFYIIVFCLCFSAAACNPVPDTYIDGVVRLAGQEVRIEIADDELSRQRGLSGRSGLTDEQGMLFIMEGSARHSFWMKDMQFAIDIVWIEDGVVVDLTYDVRPQHNIEDENLLIYRPSSNADLVLELRAGWAQKYGLKTGDKVEFNSDEKFTSATRSF